MQKNKIFNQVYRLIPLRNVSVLGFLTDNSYNITVWLNNLI